MGEIRTRDKRDKLRLLYAGTPAGGTEDGPTLSQTLMAALRVADEAVSTGSFVVSNSEAGGSTSLQILAEFSPVAARRLVGELLDLYDRAVAQLESADDDADTYALMMGSLAPIREYHADFTSLGMHPADSE